MAKADILIRLINTLTKAEKRYFRLYSSLQQGSKDYVKLFDLLESTSFKNAATAKEAFNQQFPGTAYEVCSRYLYKVIMDCLLHLRLHNNQTAMLAAGLLKTEILFEKSLYEEGQRQLQRIQQTAQAREKHLLLLWALQQERQALLLLNFPDISEKTLAEKQAQAGEILQYLQHHHQHISLYEQLRHHLLYKGPVRTNRQKELLNDLLRREQQLLSQQPVKALESVKTHLLFQANYFLVTANYKSALKAFHELNKLLETHEHLSADTPADHLFVIEGILDSLRSTRRYGELHKFLDKVRRLRSESPYFEVMIQRLLFIYETAGYIDNGNFSAAQALHKQYAHTLLKKMHLLDIGKQAEIHLYVALAHLGNEDINSAHASLEKVLQQSNIYGDLPIFRTFKLIHLLLHYELGNYEYIRYETRAFRRQLQPDSRRSFLLERTVIKFLHTGELPAAAPYRTAMWKKISATFEKIKADKYEMQLLKLFDFSAWIEAKLKRQSLGGILKEKYQREAVER